MGRTLKVEEVCERLGVSRKHLNQMHYLGEAPPRIAVSKRRFLYDEESLEAWLKSREQGTRASVGA
jgi:predicted DNA-binding transcriptional regulator AlpA